MFETCISVVSFYVFLYYRLFSGSNDIEERSIMQLTPFDELVATVHTCLEQRRNRGE